MWLTERAPINPHILLCLLQNVTCVIFVASLSEFDQTLAEESTQNRMAESLQLFREVTYSKYFRTKVRSLCLCVSEKEYEQ